MTYNRLALEKKVEAWTANESDHNINHHRRVYALARKIAELEKLEFDDEILHAASITHDAGYPDKRCYGDLICHIKYGMEFASKTLPTVGFPHEKLPVTLECIRLHDFTKHWAFDGGLNEKTDITEVKLLQDADNDDGYGVLGLFRIALYDQKVGKKFYDPNLPLDTDLFNSRKVSSIHNMLYHVDYTGRMNFKSAEQMMAEKKPAMEKLIQQLLEQLNAKR